VIDEDGFLRITDRLSRFSKFGGAGINESAVK
jgi:acyl-CoA synthetase (AMP-forming)/AMP-acid ligase II